MATLVLKSFPDHLHAFLKESARAHRRSLTQEAIVLFEQLHVLKNSAPKKIEKSISLETQFPNRKFVPGYLAAYKAGAFSGGTDSSIIISEERDAR